MRTLVDVRTMPRSRHNPQFNRDELSTALAGGRDRLRPPPRLGGLRRDSGRNRRTWAGATTASGATPTTCRPPICGRAGRAVRAEADGPVALMCAEAVPWRCHRSLIADALLIRGIPSSDIQGPGKTIPHKLTPFAHVEDERDHLSGRRRAASRRRRRAVGKRKTENQEPMTKDQRRMTRDLSTVSPFSLEATVRLLQRRPANRIDRWVDGEYRRAVRTPEGMRLIALRDAGSVDAPDLRMELIGGPVGEESSGRTVAMVRWMLGLDAELPPAEWLAGQESLLAPTLDRLRGFRPPAFPDLFAACLAVLPYQQLSLDAGTAIMGRLVERSAPASATTARIGTTSRRPRRSPGN